MRWHWPSRHARNVNSLKWMIDPNKVNVNNYWLLKEIEIIVYIFHS